jgi:hypothetical protein
MNVHKREISSKGKRKKYLTKKNKKPIKLKMSNPTVSISFQINEDIHKNQILKLMFLNLRDIELIIH